MPARRCGLASGCSRRTTCGACGPRRSSPRHGNTDFDAFAAMLAARRLYPGAVVAVGALNRNVRDFYRLHADELEGVVEIGAPRARRDPAPRRRRGGERVAARRARAGRARPERREGRSSTTTARPSSRTGSTPTTAVLSTDGALTTTLVGILAERELEPTALEATTFALGIHEDTGSLTYATTHAARRRRARLVPPARRAPGSRRRVPAHAARARASATSCTRLLEALEPVDAAGEEVLLAAVRWPEYVEGVSNLAHKIVDLTDTKALVLLVEMDERVFAVVRSRTRRRSTPPRSRARSAAAATRRPRRRSRAASLDEARALVLAAARERAGASRVARATSCRRRRAPSSRDESVRDAMVALPAARAERRLRGRRTGRVVGSVSREDLDKAIGHGLAHAPVRGIMSGQVAHRVRGHHARRAPAARHRAPRTGASPSLRDERARRRRRPRRPPARARGRRAATARGAGESLADELRALERLRPLVRRRRARSATAPTASTSSAAPCATSSSARRASTSTSRSRATRSSSRERSPTRSADASRRIRSSAPRSSSTATTGASTSSRRARSSTTRPARCRRSSARGCARISSAATSRSTRWRSR